MAPGKDKFLPQRTYGNTHTQIDSLTSDYTLICTISTGVHAMAMHRRTNSAWWVDHEPIQVNQETDPLAKKKKNQETDRRECNTNRKQDRSMQLIS